MAPSFAKILYWTPRVLTMLFAAFISIFALDVFEEHQTFWMTAVALFMHLLPTFAVIALLLIAWKWEWVGTAGFFCLATFYVYWAWGRFPLSVYFVIAGPMVLIGALFLAGWLTRYSLQTGH
jgi:hypothetical protein